MFKILFSRYSFYLTTVFFSLIAVLIGLTLLRRRPMTIDARPESEVELTVTEQGITYKLYKGNLYSVDGISNKWIFAQRVYDVDYFSQNYVEQAGMVHRKDGAESLIPVRYDLADGFDYASSLADLIGIEHQWTSCELQSPKTPSKGDYIKLRNAVLKGEADFVDNLIEPATEITHNGQKSLKTVSFSPSGGMITSKASLSTELLHFIKGDDVYLSAWFYVPNSSGMPFTLADLETTWFAEYPGIRLVITDGKFASLQLKWAGHKYYNQPKGKEVSFPKNQWVQIEWHLKLSDDENGIIELWQDKRKIIDTRGKTLVLSHAIYNSFEIGITAYNEKGRTCTLFVDDILLSKKPLKK